MTSIATRSVRALRWLYVRSNVRTLLPLATMTWLRRLWIRTARAIDYPVSSPRSDVRRPPLDPTRSNMRLSHVLMACDLNPDYLDFWPSTRRAWEDNVGIAPTLVLVATAADIPEGLREDESVTVFEPLPGLHSAFQAQCIRLLYPALVATDDAVLISDIDLYPLKASYFHKPISKLDSRFFVTYRDNRLHLGEVNIMFNAATPKTWGEIFEVGSLEDVRARLSEWSDGLTYDGRRGWDGWYTDQQLLYRRLAEWPQAARRFWTLDDDYCGFNRLDRMELEHEDGLEPHRVRGLQRGVYTDYNCFVPYRAHKEINDSVLRLALEARTAGSARRSARGG